MIVLYPIWGMVDMYIMTYRLSMFGDFKRFTPTTTNIINWSQAFREKGFEFLPSIININSTIVPLFPTQPNIEDKRLQFVSSQGDYIVRFLANRIDVERTILESDAPEKALNEVSEVFDSLVNIISDILDNPIGTRLAFFVDAMLPEHSEIDYGNMYSNLNFGLKMQNSEKCLEWNHRFNERVNLNVGSDTEICNSIISLESAVLNTKNKTTGQITEIKGVHISADINTLPENANERFDMPKLIVFCNNAKESYFNIFKQIESLFNNNP